MDRVRRSATRLRGPADLPGRAIRRRSQAAHEGCVPLGRPCVLARRKADRVRTARRRDRQHEPRRSGRRTLTSNGRDSFPTWSPDGKQIAFIRPLASGWKVVVMSASGTGERQLPDAPPAGRPSWTSRGLLIPTNGSLAKIDPRSGHVQKQFGALIDASIGMDTTAVSPDLSTVTFVEALPPDPGTRGAARACRVRGSRSPSSIFRPTGAAHSRAQWRAGVVLARRKEPRVRGRETARAPGHRERHVEDDQDREVRADDGRPSGLAAALSSSSRRS